MSVCKPGRRVAYYQIENSTVDTVPVGTIIIDKPQGPAHYWHVYNERTGKSSGFGGKRLGFARCDAEGTPVPEPKLAAALAALREESDRG